MMVDRSGEERLTALPRPSVDSAEGGLDPDMVAQMFGRKERHLGVADDRSRFLRFFKVGNTRNILSG